MIAFIGDIHGEFSALEKILDEIKKYPEITAVVQVGDFGFYPKLLNRMKEINPHIPVYAIDGNHEDFEMFDGLTDVTEIAPNIFFVPRGTVLEIDGRTIAFMGGAASVDKGIRLRRGMHWDTRENITEEQVATFRENTKDRKIDIMITHVPPQSVIQKNFDPKGLMFFDLPMSWRDKNADIIEELWGSLYYPQLICGHMHRSVIEGTARILDINELFCL